MTKPEATAQAGAADDTNPFLTLVRVAMRAVAEQMIMEEVAALCGPSHCPLLSSLYRRAGSEVGMCHAEGRRESLLRPRVRRKNEDGSEAEHTLASYQAMHAPVNNAVTTAAALLGCAKSSPTRPQARRLRTTGPLCAAR